MKKNPLTRQSVRFRRWSRKAYAVFASLKVYVTIGCLRTGTADSSLSKEKGKRASCPREAGREDTPLMEAPLGSAEAPGLFLLTLPLLTPDLSKVQVSCIFSGLNPLFPDSSESLYHYREVASLN